QETMMKLIKVRSSRIITLSLLLGLSAVVLSLVLARPPASRAATTITVTSDADAGGTCPGASCTLRQAIATASPGDTINFAAGLTTVNLTTAELLINKNLTISGPGVNLLTVQRSHTTGTVDFHIFDIAPGNFNVTISGLTITNGNVNGGGIFNESGGIVTVTSCLISKNLIRGGDVGGGIYNNGGFFNKGNGSLTISNSTISGNSAIGGGLGGGI